jgi:O-antigen ligase
VSYAIRAGRSLGSGLTPVLTAAAAAASAVTVVVAPQAALVIAVAIGGLGLVALGAWPPLLALLVARMYGDVAGPIGRYADIASGGLAVAVVVLAVAVPLRDRGRGALVAVYVLLAVSIAYAASEYGDASGFTREWLRLASIAALAVLAASAAQAKGGIERSLRFVLAAVVVPAVVALAQFAGVGQLAAGQRAFGTFSHPNAAGATFAFALLTALALALRSRRGLDWALVALFCAALFTTRSLGALAAAVIGTWALTHFRLTGVRRGLLVAAIVGALAIFALTPVGAERISQLESTRSYSAAAQGDVSNSLDWRFLNWHLLLGEWRYHPVFGTGAGSTRQFVQPLGTLPHNEYLRVLVEGGVVGALVAALGLAALVRAVRRRVAASLPGSLGRALLLAACVDALVDNLFNYTSAAYLAAVGIGLALGASRTEADCEAGAAA